MKKIILITFLIQNFISFGQLIYVNNNNAVYPLPVYQNTSSSTPYSFDINNDGQLDVELLLNYVGGYTICNSIQVGGPFNQYYFAGKTNSYGVNKVNSSSVTNALGIDCTNDTLNSFDLWNNSSFLYKGEFPSPNCLSLGFGSHKQGVRLILTNPVTGVLGYKYAYIDYSLTNGGDVIIHGWYYEDTFNVPIVANSQLLYPYDADCIHYDTVTVYDTVMVYDTTLIAVTDTLIINSNLNLPSPNDFNTIKVYPNPANDHITIDNGNYLIMQNHSIKIENSLGQQEFYSLINQQQFYIDITGWSGSGVYYLSLLDSQNIILTTRKIVIL